VRFVHFGDIVARTDVVGGRPPAADGSGGGRRRSSRPEIQSRNENYSSQAASDVAYASSHYVTSVGIQHRRYYASLNGRFF